MASKPLRLLYHGSRPVCVCIGGPADVRIRKLKHGNASQETIVPPYAELVVEKGDVFEVVRAAEILPTVMDVVQKHRRASLTPLSRKGPAGPTAPVHSSFRV